MMAKKALIFYGGWEGHEPEKVGPRFGRILEGHGYEVDLVETLDVLADTDRMGEYDLIVIGATGEDDLKHDLLGSVSTKVAQAAPCSTLIVKF